MDKPCWDPINREKIFKKIYFLWPPIGFVITPGLFNFKTLKSLNLDITGHVSTIIVNLSCKNDSGWFSDVKNVLERDRKWSRSKIMLTSPFSVNLGFKNSKSTDNGHISTVIMILSCKIDRGWFSNVKHCVEHDLKWLRTKDMSLWPFYWDFNHCEYIPATLWHDAKIYIRVEMVQNRGPNLQ